MPRKPTKSEISAFLSAAHDGDVAAVRAFIEKGGHPDSTLTEGGASALFDACSSGDTEMVEVLLDSGANPNRSNWSTTGNARYRYPLNAAAAYPSIGIMSLLLNRGASAKTLTTKSENAGHVLLNLVESDSDNAKARQDMIEEILPRLVESGLALNQPDDNGETLLHTAVKRNARASIVRFLLGAGANPNLPDGYGDYPIHYARMEKHIELIQVLVEHGALVNTLNRKGETLLSTCAHQCVPNLLQFGADPNIQDSTGMTPLAHRIKHYSSGTMCPAIVPMLDAGARIDIADFEGVTPRTLANKVPGLAPLLDARSARAAMLSASSPVPRARGSKP